MTEPGRDAVAGTLLHRFLRNWSLELTQGSAAIGGAVHRTETTVAGDAGYPTTMTNVCLLLENPAVIDGEATLRDLAAFYEFEGDAKSGTVFLFSAWDSPLPVSHGWSLVAYQPLMYRPAGGEVPHLPDGLDLNEVHDSDTLRAFELAMIRGFELEEPDSARPGVIFGTTHVPNPHIRRWIGRHDGQPAAAAEVCVAEGINHVTLVATVPFARRRGYGAALTMLATLAEPTQPAMLVATPEGQPVYERLGYVSLMPFTLWQRERPGRGLHIERRKG